jgi:hypothetical protein
MQTANGTPTMVASGKNGRYYTPETGSVQAWYPAVGFLSSSSGGLAGGGDRGSAWASAANSANAFRLYFSNIDINPNNGASRANSYSVRCLQE